ncbi:MAG: RNA methyltransferase [Clostridia bacterium]|nr:RNA methyltransferase [Clostridia bacterium]
MFSDNKEISYVGSLTDKRVEFVRGLSRRKNKPDCECFFLEGERAVSEVPLKQGSIDTLVLSRSYVEGVDTQYGRFAIIRKLQNCGAGTLYVTDKVFAAITGTVSPQGIAAVVNKPRFGALEPLLRGADRVLVLENLQDPGNLGTCIRTADAFRFDAVICTDNCADVYNQKVLRSTVGSLFHIPVLEFSEGIFKLSIKLKAAGLRLFGADPRGGVSSIDRYFGKDRTAVIIGNEARGLTDAARAVSDELVTVPMAGNAESLNAAVAAAVLMYELSTRRDRPQNKPQNLDQ